MSSVSVIFLFLFIFFFFLLFFVTTRQILRRSRETFWKSFELSKRGGKISFGGHAFSMYVRVPIKGLEMLVFRKMLLT